MALLWSDTIFCKNFVQCVAAQRLHLCKTCSERPEKVEFTDSRVSSRRGNSAAQGVALDGNQKGDSVMKTAYLLNEELGHVLAALTPTNRLVARVCLQTGLRLGDVLALRTEQLSSNFWVTESKTGKRKQVGLDSYLLADLREQAGSTYVFPGRLDPGKPRSRQAVWTDIKRAAKAFRLPQNVAPHSLRKVYAVELMRKYGDIERVRRALNHQYHTTTMIYAMADQLLQTRGRRRKK